MQKQSFEHHTQHDTFLYGLTIFVIVLWILFWFLAKKINAVVPLNGLQYVMPVFVPLFFIALMVKMRRYATTLQDRIIRQEVQFRYFVGTGKTLQEEITFSHMIWLRFAWDSEFISLVNQIVAKPSLSAKEIKQKVKNWKGDFNRV